MAAIPKTMKAAVVTEQGKIVIKDVPVPEPGRGEVLIKIITSGVCHTDLHAMDMDWAVKPKIPIIPGHEGAGVVAKVGPGVEHLKVGDRVGSAWLHDSCMNCDHCLSGWETVCAEQHQTGYFSDGCFAEYTVALEKFVGRIPDAVPFVQASPIMCAGVTTYKGLKMTEVKPGQWVAIHGASGGLGHVAVQYAKAMGMKVCAIDFGPDKIKYCQSIGADAGVDAKEGDVVAKVKEATNGGPHGALILAPALAAYEQAALYVRPRGTVAGCGLPPGQFKVDVLDMILGAKTIRGSIVGTRTDLVEALNIAADGKVTCTVVEKKMEDIHEIFDDMHHGKIKGRVVLRFAPDE